MSGAPRLAPLGLSAQLKRVPVCPGEIPSHSRQRRYPWSDRTEKAASEAAAADFLEPLLLLLERRYFCVSVVTGRPVCFKGISKSSNASKDFFSA